MSTVPEAIVANYCGMKVLGISCLTNYAAGVTDSPLNHQEVIDTANRVKDSFKSLLSEVIKQI
jgi:purine-nucleoside phosphorylase